MKGRLDVIARRRAVLVQQIAAHRDGMASVVGSVRTQLAVAGLGLFAGRLLRRSRWLRRLAAGAAVVSMLIPLAARLIAQRR